LADFKNLAFHQYLTNVQFCNRRNRAQTINPTEFFIVNEFVPNALLDNIGSKNQPLISEKNEVIFLF
jgi:hypothetical protein